MKEGYDKGSEEMKKELAALGQEKHKYTHTLTPQNRWIAALKGYQAEEAVTRQMAEELIQKIYVSKRDEITIVWNFQDEFALLDAEARREGARE